MAHDAKHKKSRKGGAAKMILIVLLILVLAAGGCLLAIRKEINGSASAGEPVSVSIQQGSGVAAIAQKLKTVGVIMPFNYRSIVDHLYTGKDWGLDRKKGGLFMVPGNAYGTTKGGMRFLLRDIISNKTLFQRSDKPYVVMMGTNIIFNMDLNTIIEAHENSGAQMTVVYCKATRNVDDETKLQINENGRLTGVSAGVVYGDNASMDCCIVNRETLLEIIDHYQAADYLDLLEALQGDFGNIDVCSYEYKGEVVGVFSEKS